MLCFFGPWCISLHPVTLCPFVGTVPRKSNLDPQRRLILLIKMYWDVFNIANLNFLQLQFTFLASLIQPLQIPGRID